MKRYTEPAPPPAARLDRYRNAAAALYDGDRFVAHLVTRVDVWWTTEGPWWRRHNVRPEERITWLLHFEPGFDLAHPDGWDDGADADVAELDRDCFRYRGRALRVSWLEGQEADAVLTEHGWP